MVLVTSIRKLWDESVGSLHVFTIFVAESIYMASSSPIDVYNTTSVPPQNRGQPKQGLQYVIGLHVESPAPPLLSLNCRVCRIFIEEAGRTHATHITGREK